MDILSIAPQTITVEIKHPATGKPLGISVTCQSMECDEVKSVQRQIRNRAMKSGRNSLTAEKVEDGALQILGAVIIGWDWKGDIDLGGVKKPECTGENKAKMLALPWFAGQVDAAVGDESAFFTS